MWMTVFTKQLGCGNNKLKLSVVCTKMFSHIALETGGQEGRIFNTGHHIALLTEH